MPALPTLNLLSWSTDRSAAGLSADANGADGSAFRAALSDRLSVTQADAVDAAVPGMLMPLDLTMQVESLPNSALLVLPTADAGTGGSQLLSTDGMDLVEVPMLSPPALPLQEGLQKPLVGAMGNAALLPSGDETVVQETVVQIAASSLFETAPAGVSPAVASLPADSDTARPELLRQAAIAGSDAQRNAGDPARSGVPGTGLQGTSPSAMPIATPIATPIAQASLPGQAGADDPLNPPPALMAGAPIASPDAQDSDFVQQLAAAGDLSRGAASAIQPADGGLDALSTTAWTTHTAAARESAGTAPMTLTLNRPMASPEWNQELGERIVWLADNNRQSAELQLNPRDLGPLMVRISVVDDVARVAFTAQNAVTREALEAAMPQLKEMLQSQGLSLGEANVSADNAPAEQQANAGERSGYGDEAAAGDDADESAPIAAQTRHEGLFDGYA